MESVARFAETCVGKYVHVEGNGKRLLVSCCNEEDDIVLQFYRDCSLSVVGLVKKEHFGFLLNCPEEQIFDLINVPLTGNLLFFQNLEGVSILPSVFYDHVKEISKFKNHLIQIKNGQIIDDLTKQPFKHFKIQNFTGKISPKLFLFWKRTNQKRSKAVTFILTHNPQTDCATLGICQTIDCINIAIFGKIYDYSNGIS